MKDVNVILMTTDSIFRAGMLFGLGIACGVGGFLTMLSFFGWVGRKISGKAAHLNQSEGK